MVTSKDKVLWRIIAGILCLIWAGILLLYAFIMAHPQSEGTFPSPFLAYICYVLTIIGTMVLIVFPLQFYIYAFFCSLWGILKILDGGGIGGILMYGLGLTFAFKQGFFKTFPRLKIALAVLVLLVALVSQIQYGIVHITETLFGFFELLLIAGLVGILFMREIKTLKEMGKQNGKFPYNPAFSVTGSELRLSRNTFTGRDIQILQKILNGDKYEAVASEFGIGLSTLKKRLTFLFSLLEISDKVHFLEQFENHTILFDDLETGDNST